MQRFQIIKKHAADCSRVLLLFSLCSAFYNSIFAKHVCNGFEKDANIQAKT